MELMLTTLALSTLALVGQLGDIFDIGGKD